MNRTACIVTIGVVLLGVASTFGLHGHARSSGREKELALRQQNEQMATLLAEQRSLSNRLAAARSSTNNPLAELAQLRQAVATLQKRTNDLGWQIQSNLQARAHRPAPKTEPPHTEEYWQQLHQLAGGKPRDAVALGMATAEFVGEHQGHFPSSTDQVASYLQPEGQALTGTNQFDYVFHGTMDDLKGIPLAAIAVMRERQTWLAPSGKAARVYGMANGVGQIVESDDNFQAWEAEHVLPSSDADP